MNQNVRKTRQTKHVQVGRALLKYPLKKKKTNFDLKYSPLVCGVLQFLPLKKPNLEKIN